MIRHIKCYIVSTYQTELPERANDLNTAHELGKLSKAGTFNKLVRGTFNGIEEKSIVVRDQASAKLIAWAYNQECYLEINEDRSAFFIYPDGRSEYQGIWSSCDDDFEGDHTYDPSTSTKYRIEV